MMNTIPDREKAPALPLNIFAGIEEEFSAEGLFRWAVWLQSCGAIEEAIEYYGKALAAAPDLVEAVYNIGILRYEQKKWPAAIAHFEKVLQQKPDFTDAAFNLAAALKENGSYTEAAEMYLKTLQLDPNLPLAHYYRARCLQSTGDHTGAIVDFQRAIALEPDNALYWFHLAGSVLKTKSIDHVLACYQKALNLKPNWDRAHYNLAVALRLKGRLEDAIAHMQRALELNPAFEDAQAYIFRLAQHACDWPLTARAAAQLDALTDRQLQQDMKTAEVPMASLRRQANPRRNASIARSWSRHIARKTARLTDRPIFKFSRRSTDRLRIGYLSSDFKDHAVAHQIRGMLAAHNRQNFEIFGYVANADDGTRYRRLLCDACDQTRDIHGLSPTAAARKIYADSIHILVEMTGHSRDSLLSIASMRPAPIQVSYLGFLGSTGAEYIDYTLADNVVVPPAHTIHYSEKVVYLPHCYQVNDDQQPISKRSFDRRDFSLPADGFVFCCFNQPYKIDSQLFSAWMTILNSVDGSVLWLIERSALAKNNLKHAAEKAGVDPARLVFTGFIPLEDNLARLKLADLVLDTWQYNGGATTSNALWAGVPVLTVPGGHWVSRMTASALAAIGMPELIAPDRVSYQKIAIDLACQPARLSALRRKLAKQRVNTPLFDTRLFTQHLETAFQTMWARYASNQAPIGFDVKPLNNHCLA
jgi:protein O-GlcNAc transferase